MQPISGDELIALIPQKPPFVMIGKLLETDGVKCTTSFAITGNNVLCDNGKLNVSGLIENMAQTAAAMSGYICMIEDKTPSPGFIGEVRNFWVSELPGTGDEIITEVCIENEVFDVKIISGTVKLHDEVIAYGEMKIFHLASNSN